MLPDQGLWLALIIIFITLIIAAPVVIFSGYLVVRLFKNSARNRQILATGEPAQAIIVSAADTGVTINGSPQARLTLEIRPVGRQPYLAETTFLVGRLQTGMIMPGMPVQVRFDPADPSRVAIESLGGAPQMWQRPYS